MAVMQGPVVRLRVEFPSRRIRLMGKVSQARHPCWCNFGRRVPSRCRTRCSGRTHRGSRTRWLAGLTSAHWSSDGVDHDQGISRRGSRQCTGIRSRWHDAGCAGSPRATSPAGSNARLAARVGHNPARCWLGCGGMCGATLCPWVMNCPPRSDGIRQLRGHRLEKRFESGGSTGRRGTETLLGSPS